MKKNYAIEFQTFSIQWTVIFIAYKNSSYIIHSSIKVQTVIIKRYIIIFAQIAKHASMSALDCNIAPLCLEKIACTECYRYLSKVYPWLVAYPYSYPWNDPSVQDNFVTSLKFDTYRNFLFLSSEYRCIFKIYFRYQ